MIYSKLIKGVFEKLIAIALLLVLTPVFISVLNRFGRRGTRFLLFSLPCISSTTAIAYFLFVAQLDGWNMEVELLFSNFPVFWIPHYLAGLLLSRMKL